MVCTDVEMCLKPRTDWIDTAPGHHRVKEALAAASSKLILAELKPTPVVAILGHGHVARKMLYGHRPGGIGIRREADLLLDTDSTIGAQNRSSLCGMFGWHIVRKSAVRVVARRGKQLRIQRRKDDVAVRCLDGNVRRSHSFQRESA